MCIYIYIYILLTVIGLTPGNSSTVHVYTQNNKINLGRVRTLPRLCELYPGIWLTTKEKAPKTPSQDLEVLWEIGRRINNDIILLTPTGYVMYQQFNIQQLYALPHCFYVFCIYLRRKSDLCHLQHNLAGFYNRDEKCLLRSTDWVFK